MECKSGKLRWDQYHNCWIVKFDNVKLADPPSETSFFDDLLLALYTPRGVCLYRHNGNLGLNRNGARTGVAGHSISLSGPAGVQCWNKALDEILWKLDESGWRCLAFVDWFQ